ncbi:MAG: histidinol-phosphate transaminase [Rudaea sp.]
MKLLERARPEILSLQPYSSARMESRSRGIMLNANESPWPPVGNETTSLNRYPDPQPTALRVRMAELYDVAPERVLMGRGSDEAIDLLVRAFCREGRDAIVVSPPTFGMYAVAAAIQGARVIDAPLGADFAVDVDAVLAAITENTKIVFVCTPNNPTGAVVPLTTIARLADALRDRALLVVDEAYLEFAGGAPSATILISRHENVAVLRTLSKAYALAGARVGALVADAQIVALLRRIQAPYPLPSSSVAVALTALGGVAVAEAQARVAILLSERDSLAPALARARGVLAILPSSANFLCVRFADAAQTYQSLIEHGVVVRDVGRYAQLEGCLRISVGTPAENWQLLAALGLRRAVA